MSETDYLTKDTLLPEGQRFVCLSFLTPSEENKHTLNGIKIRGVFPNYEMACNHAKKLQSVDKYFNVLRFPFPVKLRLIGNRSHTHLYIFKSIFIIVF